MKIPSFIIITVFMCTLVSAAPAKAVLVTTAAELAAAVDNANSGGDKTITVAPGSYTISSILFIYGDNVTIQGKSTDRSKAVIRGQGMSGSVMHVFLVYGDYCTIRNLTLRNVANHAIQLQPGADFLTARNLHILDTGEQMLKGAYDSNNPSEHCDNGLVERCLFEYSAGIGPQWYIGGIDVHRGEDWIVRDNTFKYIRSPSQAVAEHGVHFWSNAANTLVERNIFVTCDRAIGFGLGASGHSGGIIRNNMIYHDTSEGFADVGIGLESSPDTKVYNNTILHMHSYSNAIEYRFAATTNVLIANNLTNKAISSRDGGTGTLSNNVTSAAYAWFNDPPNGSLHLNGAYSAVVDQGTAVAGLMDDLDQGPRPYGGGMDIGADEFGSIGIPAVSGFGFAFLAGLPALALLRRRGYPR